MGACGWIDPVAVLAWRDFIVGTYSDAGQQNWLRDVIQPFPTFTEIYVAGLKALGQQIAATHQRARAASPSAENGSRWPPCPEPTAAS
jgi:hypothetical protein